MYPNCVTVPVFPLLNILPQHRGLCNSHIPSKVASLRKVALYATHDYLTTITCDSTIPRVPIVEPTDDDLPHNGRK